MRRIDRKFLFDKVRKTLFGGSLTERQVYNINQVLDQIEAFGIEKTSHAAAILAVPVIETGMMYAPVREGFAHTDAQAIAHVKRLYKRGVISRDYSVPAGPYGRSYFGRGYPQLTWWENYRKTGEAIGEDLEQFPEKMLEPETAAKAMIWGMKAGAFRKGKSLSMLRNERETAAAFFEAREIINGDKNRKRSKSGKTIGAEYADYAMKFQSAIVWEELPEPPGAAFLVAPLDKPAKGSYMTLWERAKAFFLPS